ncbi:Calmodulin-like protein 1 [Nymphaea thermarum]|nr:Calmodulin-like protein 1 [Nymphaea thermarum]
MKANDYEAPFRMSKIAGAGSLHSPNKGQVHMSIKSFSRKSSRQNGTISGATKLFQCNSEEMRRVFAKFDANKDGKLSAEELGRMLKALGRDNSQAEVMSMMKVADTDNDGFIDFNEFMAVVGKGGGVKESDMQSAFHVFDVDGDGKISGEEVFQVLKRLGERCSLEECKRMVKGVDKDGDGKVDIQEFMVMMTNNMEMSLATVFVRLLLAGHINTFDHLHCSRWWRIWEEHNNRGIKLAGSEAKRGRLFVMPAPLFFFGTRGLLEKRKDDNMFLSTFTSLLDDKYEGEQKNYRVDRRMKTTSANCDDKEWLNTAAVTNS